MPKIYRSGKIEEMTQAEIIERDCLIAGMSEPTPEERIAELEEAFALLLSGVTE